MYHAFRNEPRSLGYLDHVFTMHAKCFTSDVLTRDSPKTGGGLFMNKMDEKVGNMGKVFICVYLCLLQVMFSCKARRRGRGDWGTISNSESHAKYGNRANFVDALFQNLPGKQSKQKDKQNDFKRITYSS